MNDFRPDFAVIEVQLTQPRSLLGYFFVQPRSLLGYFFVQQNINVAQQRRILIENVSAQVGVDQAGSPLLLQPMAGVDYNSMIS